MMITRILVAYDFSDASKRALLFAQHLAEQTSARLELVHVIPDLYDGRADLDLELPGLSPGQGERYLRFVEEELHRAVETTLPGKRSTTGCHVSRGDPVKRIEAFAREIGADLICMGSTGKGAVARLMLGSISQLVLRTSTIPVVTVP